MIRVEHPEFLLTLIAVIIIGAIYFVYQRWRRKALTELGDTWLLPNLIPGYSLAKSVLKFALAVGAFVLIIAGLVNVQMGSAKRMVKHSGIDIVFLVDVSNSMLATDAAPNRLEAAKQAAGQLINLFPDSRIAVVSFAGSAQTLLPLTPDHAAAQMVLFNLYTNYAETQGSDLGGAITEAIGALPMNQNRYRAIVLLSDGEDHEHNSGSPLKEAVEKGIVICCAGTGSVTGSNIPLPNSGLKKDKEGNLIVSRLNASLLREVAKKTNGLYAHLENNTAVNMIASRLDAIQKNTFDEQIFVEYESRFQYFLLPALFLLLLETFISGKKRKINPGQKKMPA